MGINISIETETGNIIEELGDQDYLFEKLLSGYNDSSSFCLRFIDPYGNTIFNQSQIPILAKELENRIDNCNNEAAKIFGNNALILITKAINKANTYIKFSGD